jgi:hypothetical protein
MLMSTVWPNFNVFLRTALGGFELPLASTMLPWWTYLRPSALIHIHLHSRMQRRYAAKPGSAKPAKVPPRYRAAIIDSLEAAVQRLSVGRKQTEWRDYSRQTGHYPAEAIRFKHSFVESTLTQYRPDLVYDLGGNTGEYARIATQQGIDCVCYDLDPLCVNYNYLQSKARKDTHMLPLLMDVANPSPALGFASSERLSFSERSQPDLVIALALIHHLRLTCNIPIERIAEWLGHISKRLLIEFVPVNDAMAQILIKSRRRDLDDYVQANFEAAFLKRFALERYERIPGTARALYLFRAS